MPNTKTDDKAGSAIAESFAQTIPAVVPPDMADVDAVLATMPDLKPATVYRWHIPSANGYVLPVEVADGFSAEHARAFALTIIIPTEGAEGEGQTGRELTAMERAWITATEPEVIVDTTAITLNHFRALQENEDLRADSAQYANAKATFEALGINPEDPAAWRDGVQSAMDELHRSSEARLSQRSQRLATMLTNVMDALELARNETGFAPAKPVPVPEPDYSGITILAPEGAKRQFPRLKAATWVEKSPAAPMDADEQHAWEQLVNPDYGVIAQWRMGVNASPEDVDKMERFVNQRLRSLVQ